MKRQEIAQQVEAAAIPSVARTGLGVVDVALLGVGGLSFGPSPARM